MYPGALNSIGKKPSVKADLAICDQVLSAAFTYRQKWISVVVAIRLVFPRPGHILTLTNDINILISIIYYYFYVGESSSEKNFHVLVK